MSNVDAITQGTNRDAVLITTVDIRLRHTMIAKNASVYSIVKYCRWCTHEADRHTPIGCDVWVSDGKTVGQFASIVKGKFCDCELTAQDLRVEEIKMKAEGYVS